ncbi:DNA ligase D [Oceanobacillus sp. J11TS1]|uniref:DNA ligase D n=1 Tax=Oceanobacillus sp. J11TS1 TaxID=2807191 RepID=UPI001B21EA26|nr:DNA ligase D [Oceanobacillus sp. J11TS1]GIO24286.1 bifunctional non-homologous end joining protein LigD [Oceanobacillus sp. J11TS1]
MDWMKPIAKTEIPEGNEWLYEVKYDGFRCKLKWVDKDDITLMSKNNYDILKKFPEINHWCKENYEHFQSKLPLELDGELVILNHFYQANFEQIQMRGRLQNVDRIEKQANQRPATFMVFDITEINGNKLHQENLSLRKQHLHQLMESIPGDVLKCVETFTSISAIQEVVFSSKSEGIVAKREKSTYQKGKKHADWFKIKNWRVIQGILTEYNPSNEYFTVNVLKEDGLMNIGSCKHGLSKDSIQMLKKLFKEQGDYMDGIYHLPPAITSMINTLDLYDQKLREPEFKKIDPSISYTECTLDKLQLDIAQLPGSIEVSHTEKYLWPNVFTKKDLLVYLREISPWMLPFLRNRALTIIRCPDGISKESFFQKNLPDYAPSYLSSHASHEDEIVCNHVEGIVWLANHGSIEYHLPFQRIGHVTPLEIVFDLDPPDREHFALAVRAAKLLKEILDNLELVSYVKTSGNKGLQVYIPIREGSMTYEETSLFTEAIAKTIERAYPDDFTTERMKKKRNNRLYLDYVQHGKDKTLIAPYSPRRTEEGTVSTPLYWYELNEDLDPAAFTIGNVLHRLQQSGCPFEGYQAMHEQQHMGKILQLVRSR